MVCVTWNDAQDYARWLSQRTGYKYRLLTEAEWEYAARAGTTTAFPWGSSASHDFANYGADACCAGLASGRDRWMYTSPAGSFPPNAFGLHDMSGNVLQWVQDCFAASYSGLPADGSAYETAVALQLTGRLSKMTGTSSCAYRMVRGGDWGDHPADPLRRPELWSRPRGDARDIPERRCRIPRCQNARLTNSIDQEE